MNGADIIGGILYGMAMGMAHQYPPPPMYYAPPVQRPYYPPPQPQYYSPLPPVNDGLSRSEFSCTQYADGTTTNPVVQTNVTLAFNPQSQFVSIKVIHRFYNGAFVNRWTQYPNAMVSFQDNVYGWKGNWNRDPSKVMAGGLYMGTNSWNYREKQWVNGQPNFDQTAACTQTSGPIINGSPPVASTVAPPVASNEAPKATGIESIPPQPGYGAPKVAALSPTQSVVAPPPARTLIDSVPIYKYKDGTGMLIDVMLGGYPMRMLLDTGAEVGSIPYSMADQLVKNGKAEYLTDGKIKLADGSHITEKVYVVYEVRIGSHTLKNVPFTATGGQTLLGFPVINEIGKWTVDTRNSQIVFGG